MDVLKGGDCFWRWKEYFSVEFAECGGDIDWVVELSRFESFVGRDFARNFDLN